MLHLTLTDALRAAVKRWCRPYLRLLAEDLPAETG